MDNKAKTKLVLAVLFSVVFMAFLLSRVELEQFSLIADRVDVKGLIIAWIIFVVANIVRAVRFNKLDHTGNKLIHWWNITAFYNVTTATLPGGVGEAASAYVIKRYAKLNMLSALRILFLSRLMDLSAISGIFLIAAVQISGSNPYRNVALLISGILFLLSLIALIPASEQFIMRMLQKLPGNSALMQRMSEKMSGLIEIAEEQRTKNVFGMALFQSVVMMVVGVISIHLVLNSLGINFTIVQSAYCYGVYMVFQVVPVQGVAGIGTQAAWWALALNAVGYKSADLIALGFVLHGTFYVFIGAIGLTALFTSLVNRRCN